MTPILNQLAILLRGLTPELWFKGVFDITVSSLSWLSCLY